MDHPTSIPPRAASRPTAQPSSHSTNRLARCRWKTGNDLASYASPVLAKIGAQNTVFMFARGGLLAIDPAKGETIAQFPWRARLLESVNASSPVVMGDEVFISET